MFTFPVLLGFLVIAAANAIRYDLRHPEETRTGQLSDALDTYRLELEIQEDRSLRAAEQKERHENDG